MALTIVAPSDYRTERRVLENMEKIGMLTIPYGATLPTADQLAFDAALMVNYVQLVDIRPMQMPNNPTPIMARCFILTTEGTSRLRQIRETHRLDAAIGGAS